MAEELPILVAAVTDEKGRELAEASRLGRTVWVPLEREPARPGPHRLDVYTASSDAPLRLLAEPLGTTSERGSALRLYPWEEVRPETAPPVAPADPFVGRAIAGGRYEILARLGEGSIGAVYSARHTGLGNMVAVKVLHMAFQQDVEFCRRFYAEALALSRLDHANLVHIYDFGQEPDGLLYLAMAFVEGATLRAMQRTERVFEVPRIVSLMLEISGGLGHAHGRGLIHRDVKPDNVMVVAKEDDDGHRVERVKVLDFGFAVPPSVSGEVAQRLAGTPVYMSPEQCLGEELDARSDVYACGVMMYELATGTVPFLARDAESIRRMHVSMPAPLVSANRPDVDPRFDALVRRALAKSRHERHPNMQELRAELKSLLAPAVSPSSGRGLAGARGQDSRPSLPAPSSPTVSPPPSRPSTADWLEDRAEGFARFMDEARTTPAAEALAKDTHGWLGELVRERDRRAFVRRLAELEDAVRVLAQRGDAATLQRVSVVVSGLADRGERDPGVRDALAGVARLFADPELLGPIAERLLAPQDAQPNEGSAAADLIAGARVAGAYALYGARTRIAADQRARIAFVTTMKSLGDSASPVIRAALARLYEQATSGQHRAATELAEDLLLGVSKADDEVTGQLALKFASSPVPSLCRAAARAMTRVWGERARPVLLHLLQHEDDSVLVAAAVGLREIDAVDLEAVARIAAQVAAGRVRTRQLHAVIAETLRSATASASAEAAGVLQRLGAG
ncbi:MAG: serine/threonine protein kinase [Labilithrix sp.]|nr:serine/threonine protein kinase [Labilithrix sp.]